MMFCMCTLTALQMHTIFIFILERRQNHTSASLKYTVSHHMTAAVFPMQSEMLTKINRRDALLPVLMCIGSKMQKSFYQPVVCNHSSSVLLLFPGCCGFWGNFNFGFWCIFEESPKHSWMTDLVMNIMYEKNNIHWMIKLII